MARRKSIFPTAAQIRQHRTGGTLPRLGVGFTPITGVKKSTRPIIDTRRLGGPAPGQPGNSAYARRTQVGSAPATGPTLGATVVNPVQDQYSRYGQFGDYLRNLDAQQTTHQNYINQQVAPWLASATQGLAGFQQAAQDQYLGYLKGVGQLGNVAAAIQPANVGPTSPGGVVADPLAYRTAGAQMMAQGASQSAEQIGANQAALAKLQPTFQGQGLTGWLANYAASLPATYYQKKQAEMFKLDQFLAQQQQAAAEAQQKQQQFEAQQTETLRHNKAQEGLQARAQDQAIYRAALRQGTDKYHAPSGFIELTPGAKPPKGYQTIRLADGTYGAIKTPSAPKPASPAGTFDPSQPAPAGYVKVRQTDGSYKIVKVSQAGGGKPLGKKPPSHTPGYEWVVANGRWTQIRIAAKPAAGQSGQRTAALKWADAWWSGEAYTDPNTGQKTRPGNYNTKIANLRKGRGPNAQKSLGAAVKSFFKGLDAYGLDADTDIAIARRYFTDDEIARYAP